MSTGINKATNRFIAIFDSQVNDINAQLSSSPDTIFPCAKQALHYSARSSITVLMDYKPIIIIWW